MSTRITGVEATAAALGAARLLFRKAALEATQQVAQAVYDLSQYYVPVDTGALKASGRIEWTANRFGGEGRVTYGGYIDVYYALYVHEDVTKQHADPTCAKFLERAVAETRKDMSRLMRTWMGNRVYSTETGSRLERIV